MWSSTLQIRWRWSRWPIPAGEILTEWLLAHPAVAARGREEDFGFCRATAGRLTQVTSAEQVLYPAFKAEGIEIVPRESDVHYKALTTLLRIMRPFPVVAGFGPQFWPPREMS